MLEKFTKISNFGVFDLILLIEQTYFCTFKKLAGEVGNRWVGNGNRGEVATVPHTWHAICQATTYKFLQDEMRKAFVYFHN